MLREIIQPTSCSRAASISCVQLRSQIGDETAFRELLELYGPHLHRYTRKMMESSPTLAEDLVQEIWVAIYRGLPGLLDASNVNLLDVFSH